MLKGLFRLAGGVSGCVGIVLRKSEIIKLDMPLRSGTINGALSGKLNCFYRRLQDMVELNQLTLCDVYTDDFRRMGFLYFQTKSVTVLLNNVYANVDLGPGRPIHNKYSCPEATICIIPTKKIRKIDKYAKSHK